MRRRKYTPQPTNSEAINAKLVGANLINQFGSDRDHERKSAKKEDAKNKVPIASAPARTPARIAKSVRFADFIKVTQHDELKT